MGILDDVVINVKSAAEFVGNKAGQIVDISKLRINISELNNEITKRYTELGQYIYDVKKNGEVNEEIVAEKIAEKIEAPFKSSNFGLLAEGKYKESALAAKNETAVYSSLYVLNKEGKRAKTYTSSQGKAGEWHTLADWSSVNGITGNSKGVVIYGAGWNLIQTVK